MTKRAVVLLLLLGGCLDSSGPPPVVRSLQFPDEWGGGGPLYTFGLDRDAHSGAAAAFIARSARTGTGAGVYLQAIRAEEYRGKRLRLSGWMRHTDADSAGLWMRVDGVTQYTLKFDNMSGRYGTGTAGWHKESVVLDVPAQAASIYFGALLIGFGDMVIDDLKLEVVGTDVPETALGTAPHDRDSTLVAAELERIRRAPVNLDFEGKLAVDTATVTWLKNNSVELTTSDPGGSTTDLQPIDAMIGDARIVALGEGTHGTREFFNMKTRIFQRLVQTKGFTHFAIEATQPEAYDINRYVLTGQGDPIALIKKMYFWTWSTYEVLDLVQWMRQWNMTAPASQRVQFFGFDMQYPGAAMDSVNSFVSRASSGEAAFVTQHFNCIAGFRNNGAFFVKPTGMYLAQTTEIKNACRDSLAKVTKLLTDNAAPLTAATTDSAYALALQSARLVQQYEAMARVSIGSPARDSAMAANVDWLLSRAGSSAKMVLWAHNGHVARRSAMMGKLLAAEHGANYRNLGFLFGKGSLTAVGPTQQVSTLEASYVSPFSLEAAFLATGRKRALMDARRFADAGAPGYLRDASMRSIGSVFIPSSERYVYYVHPLPETFDILIFIAATGASQRLP